MMRGLRFCLSITFLSEVDARSELKRERQTNGRSEARPIERDRLQKRVPRIGWTGAESIREGAFERRDCSSCLVSGRVALLTAIWPRPRI